MNKTTRFFVGLLLLLCRTALADDPLLRAQPGETLLGPFPFQQSVLGTPVDARVSYFLTVQRAGDQIQVTIRGLVDLSGLQAKVGTFIDALDLPTDACASFSAGNLVASIWGQQIVAGDTTATVELQGDVDVWSCAKNVPCTKVENFQLIFYDCNPPVEIHLLNQPFDAAIPFSLGVSDPQTIALMIGNPSVTLGGQFEGVTNGILSIAGVDINQQVKGLLAGAVDPNRLKTKLPPYLTALNPTITSASFSADQGNLLASVQLSATLDTAELIQLIQALLNQTAKTSPPGPGSP